MISSKANDRIRYALDAKSFIIEIFRISLSTLNEMQENAAKFSEKENTEMNYKKMEVPSKAEEWINLELSK